MKKSFLGLILVSALLGGIFLGCSKQGKTVVVASKPHTEQYLLAEIVSQLIEGNSDIKVEKKLGIGGGTSNIQPAMLKGEIDIYPEYTGTGWLFVLKHDVIADPHALYDAVKKEYKDKFDITWTGLYGFNDTYALAVKETLAQKYNLQTYSDLAKVSNTLIFGGEPDFFARPDGYPGLEKTYGLTFKSTKQMDIGLKYQALEAGDVDVIDAFSTDGLLKKYKLKSLTDDKNFFPGYQAATLIRGETLKKYPELQGILAKLDGQINDQEMIEMNYQVDSMKKDPAAVAKQFLLSKGLIK